MSVNLHTLYRQIARELKITRDTARHWRRRWFDVADDDKSVPERLQNAPRSGSPPTFTAEKLTHLFAVACEDPRESGRRRQTMRILTKKSGTSQKLYITAPERAKQGEQTLSTDEMTGVQALERKAPDLPLAVILLSLFFSNKIRYHIIFLY